MASENLKAAQFRLQVAQFELEVAQAALIHTRPDIQDASRIRRLEIRSPINGRVLRVFQESTAVVPAGARLLELGDPEGLEVGIDVLSADGVKIKPGAMVALEHWGGEEPLLGRVRLVEPAAFLKVSALGVEEQRVNVIVDFVDPPEKRRSLGDALRVEARIVIWEHESVLKVPAGALFRHDNGWAVFVVINRRAQLRTVQIGWNNGLEAELRQGLEENDRVILYPSDRIRDGVVIAPR
jgi:HlyD family secretion protein